MSLFTIIDNFYDDPDEIRSMALGMEYFPPKESSKHLNMEAPWPGKITKDCYKPEGLDSRVSKSLGKIVVSTPASLGISGFFRISKKHDTVASFCHIDNVTEITDTRQYAGVLYLNPNNDNTGTIFYRHKHTGLIIINTIYDLKKVEPDFNNQAAWEPIDRSEMGYNRLIIYDAATVHGYGHLFGTTDEDARLTQIFLFNEIEYD